MMCFVCARIVLMAENYNVEYFFCIMIIIGNDEVFRRHQNKHLSSLPDPISHFTSSNTHTPLLPTVVVIIRTMHYNIMNVANRVCLLYIYYTTHDRSTTLLIV